MTLQNRFFPVTLRAKQMMEEGLLGEILEFRASYLHSGSSDPKAPLKWKLSAEAGGGVVADLGSHILDLMHSLVGDYKELSAMTHIAYKERPSAEDPSRMVPVHCLIMQSSVPLPKSCWVMFTVKTTHITNSSV
jgi:predicted dehydrogenase